MELYWKAIVLGLLQGLTEFFPVSSSGHLVLAQHIMGLEEPEIFFDLMLHVGTLLAVLIFLRREIIMMLKSFVDRGPEGNYGRKLLILVIIASVPTAIIGLCFRKIFIDMFSSLAIVGFTLMLTGALLLLTKLYQPRKNIGLGKMSWLLAAIIGLVQGMAITPGLSRSGATISAGLFLGLERQLAFKFSFLISIPAICGAVLLESLHLREITSAISTGPVLAGTLVAGLSGLLALSLVGRLVNKGQIWGFFPYCLALGIIAVLYS